MRRLILLISVDWVPPYLRPSGACLTLGTSIPGWPRNAVEGYTKPGLRLLQCTLETFCLVCNGESSGSFTVSRVLLWQWPT